MKRMKVLTRMGVLSVGLFLGAGAAAAQPVINEVDADTPGSDAAEFIELFGEPGAPLDGLVIVLYNGNGDVSYAAFDLDGFQTDSAGFFVLGNPGVPAVQLVFPGNTLQNGADAVALYTGNAADFPPGTPPTALGLLDAIVYDTDDADDPELLAALTPGSAQVNEAGAGDKDNHANARVSDGGTLFVQQQPTPGATNVLTPPPPIGTCGDPATAIHAVQGDGFASPLVGMEVVVEGVVVGDFQGPDGLNGFFVQEEDADADADLDTSEGIFVFEGNPLLQVSAFDRVRVGGRVSESFGLTRIDTLAGITLCEPGAGGASPSTVSLPVASVGDLEAYEGMLVVFPQTLVATGNFNQGRFGEVDLSAGERLLQPTQIATPGSAAKALQDANDRRRILLDDGSNVSNPLPLPPYLGVDGTLRAGDTTSNVTGVLSFGFGSYRIHPTEVVAFERVNERPASPPDVGGTLTVAAFNVLNYFATIDTGEPLCGPAGDQGCRGADSEAELARQRAKLVSALAALDADVVGLIEIENDAGDSIADLAEGVNDVAGAGTYDFIDTGTVGTDAIRVGILYKPGRVVPTGATAVLDDVFPFNVNTRPPVAQAFEEVSTGQVVTVVVNHFKSKGSACDVVPNPDTGTDFLDPDTGDGQGNCNLTRVEAANRLVEWLETDPTGTGSENVLVLGDLNAYANEDPLRVFEAAGYTDLLERFVGPEAYTFVFDAQAGSLDYVLAHSGILPFVTGAAAWHVHADEPRALDYNDFNQPALYRPDAFRASDHDPVVIGLNLRPVRQVQIDIKPFSRVNPVLPESRIPIAVVILSDASFEPRRVDTDTVRFGPAKAAPRLRPFFLDLNRDSELDVVLFFTTRETGIPCGAESASLVGLQFDGTRFEGTDRVRTLCRSRP